MYINWNTNHFLRDVWFPEENTALPVLTCVYRKTAFISKCSRILFLVEAGGLDLLDESRAAEELQRNIQDMKDKQSASTYSIPRSVFVSFKSHSDRPLICFQIAPSGLFMIIMLVF